MDYFPYWILIVALVVALIGLIVGLKVLRNRRHRSEGEHLVADIAKPETLADVDAPRDR
jgi:hypothetical protein